MSVVDENTQVGIEMAAQVLKISEKGLILLLEALAKMLEESEKLGRDSSKDFIIDDSTPKGKQKISELIEKHSKSGGVIALDENLTKAQLNDYQKELKKLGVDFSVVRNGKEDYSFFFAASQADIIEKGIKNLVEKKEKVLDNEIVLEKESELKEIRKDLGVEKSEKAKAAYDKDTDNAEVNKTPNRKITYENLSKNEKLLYSKLEELDVIKRSLFNEEVARVEKMFDDRFKPTPELNQKEQIGLDKLEKQAVEDKEKASITPLNKVRNIMSDLTEKEQSLLYHKTNNINENISKEDYSKIEKVFTPEQIKKIEKIVSENVDKNLETGTLSDDRKISPVVFSALIKKVKNEDLEKEDRKPVQSQQKKSEKTANKDYSLNGLKTKHTELKKEDKDQQKDKNRKQSIER